MHKKYAVLALVLLIVISFTSTVFASYSTRLDGKPNMFEPGNSTGYFIWQDREGLHIRTTTPGSKHVFSGTIHTDGAFENSFGKSVAADDFFRVNGDCDKVTFQFTNAGDTSGIDLHVYDGTYVTFNLSIDGEPVDPVDIYIGKDGWHPGSHKFTLRHDDDPLAAHSDESSRTVIIIGGPYWWHWDHGWHRPWHHW
jgi:hypothetical protein